MSKNKKWHISGKIIWDSNDPEAYTTRQLDIPAPSIDEAKETFKLLIQPKIIHGMLLTPKPKFDVKIYDDCCYEVDE